MLVLAFLQRLPVAWVAAYGFLVVALHNLLDVYHASQFGSRCLVLDGAA